VASQGTVQWEGMTAPMAEISVSDSSPPRRTWIVWLAPLASAALLWLSFFPVACGPLAWIALVPWLCLVRLPAGTKRLYLATFVGAIAFFVPVLQWMRVAHPMMYLTWIALALYCSGYVALVLYLVRLIDRSTRAPLVLSFPLVWVAIEFWRYGFIGSFASLLLGSHQHDYPGGFSWYFLGHTQHDFLEVIQIADLTGVYGVSFLVAAVNALLFEILYAREWFRRTFIGEESLPPVGRLALLRQGLAVTAVLLATLGYGVWRLRQDHFSPGPRLVLLQGNVPQSVRNASSSDGETSAKAHQVMKDTYLRLTRLAARQKGDLVVWPETSWLGGWRETRPGRPHELTAANVRYMAGLAQTPQLIGANAIVEFSGKPRSYNSAMLIDKEGRWLGRYDKIHRVPFGEYVPLGSSVLRYFVPYDFDYAVTPGEQFTRFDLPGTRWRFGVVICYEDTDPAMATPYVEGEPIDFLLNISNDGWFHGTSEHEQHLAICRFRAVECRRSVARSVNMGISAVIDSNGRVLAPSSEQLPDGVFLWTIAPGAKELPVSRWHEFKSVAGVLAAAPPIDQRSSVYARWGDWFALGCGGATLLLLVVARFRRQAAATPPE
jgi:apolipoprotein N-acyltransferase